MGGYSCIFCIFWSWFFYVLCYWQVVWNEKSIYFGINQYYTLLSFFSLSLIILLLAFNTKELNEMTVIYINKQKKQGFPQ